MTMITGGDNRSVTMITGGDFVSAYPPKLNEKMSRLPKPINDLDDAFENWYHTPLVISLDDMQTMSAWLRVAFTAGAAWQRDKDNYERGNDCA